MDHAGIYFKDKSQVRNVEFKYFSKSESCRIYWKPSNQRQGMLLPQGMKPITNISPTLKLFSFI